MATLRDLQRRITSVQNTETITKAIRTGLESRIGAYKVAADAIHASQDELDRSELIAMLEKEMLQAAEQLEFEQAAKLRDRIQELKDSTAGSETGASV